MTQAKFNKTMCLHQLYLDQHPDGVRANFWGKSLDYMDLTGANLHDAGLLGARIDRAHGIYGITGGDEPLYIIAGDPPRIHYDYHWFTIEEARRHWTKSNPTLSLNDKELRVMQTKLEAAITIARAAGWPGV